MRIKWIILSLLIASTLAFSPPSQNSRNLEIEIKAGFNGYYRPSKWTPLQVTVTSTESDFRGTLVVQTTDIGGEAHSLYQTPLSVARNNPRTVFIYVSIEDQQPTIEIKLLDQEGVVVEQQTEKLVQLHSRDIVYTVITESTLGTVDMTRRQIGAGQDIQVNWNIRDIPAESEALRSVDVMLFFDIRNGRLSAEQQAALQKWVYGGGHLILHGGASWQYAHTFFDEIMPTDLEGIGTISSLTSLGRYLGRPSDILAANEETEGYVVTLNTPRIGADVLFAIENVPIIVRQLFGAGTVDFVALDPMGAPLNDYRDRDAIWLELITSTSVRPSWAYEFEDWNSANNASRIVTSYNLPSALQMLGFLSIYIALIGPVNYIVLRILRRRELAWFTIPVLIGVFTVVAYFTGFSLRGSAPTVNYLSIVQVWPDSEVARVDGLVGIFSPRRTTYDISVDNKMTLRTIPGIEDIDRAIAEIPIIQDDGYRIADLPVDAGIVASFATSGYTPAPQISGFANWQLNQSESPNLSGEVTNSTEFAIEDAVILAKDSFLPIGIIEPGETKKFTFSGDFLVRLQEPTWRPLGNRQTINNASIYRTFPGRADRARFLYPVDPYSCSAGGYNATMAQVMINQTFNCYERGGSDEELSARRRALLLAAINSEFDYSGGRAGDIYLVGWGKQAPYAISLNNTSQNNEYETLYIVKLETQFDLESSQAIVIPPGLMTWTTIDMDNFFSDRSPYNLQVIEDDEYIFRFTPVLGLQTVKVDSLELRVEVLSGDHQRLQIALWNWQKGEWEPQNSPFNPTQPYRIDNPTPVLGPNNTLLVQVQTAENVADEFVLLMEPRMLRSQ